MKERERESKLFQGKVNFFYGKRNGDFLVLGDEKQVFDLWIGSGVSMECTGEAARNKITVAKGFNKHCRA